MDTPELLCLLEEFKTLKEGLTKMFKAPRAPIPNQSEDLNELFAALAKAQVDLPMANKSKKNGHFKSKYADLADMIKAAQTVLGQHGLAVSQYVSTEDNGSSTLTTVLGHSSGQWISSRMRINPASQKVQELGAYLTYIRRYAYAAIVGIAPDDDDDGESDRIAHEKKSGRTPALASFAPSEDVDYEVVTKDQCDELEFELDGYPQVAEQLLNTLGLRSLGDMPKSKFHSMITRVREIKAELKTRDKR